MCLDGYVFTERSFESKISALKMTINNPFYNKCIYKIILQKYFFPNM